MVLGGKDFNTIAGFEFRFQSDQFAVDFGADAAVPHFGVHRVGEVHRGGVHRQVDHITFGCEHEDLLGSQIVAQAVQELVGVGCFFLPVQKLAHPRHLIHFGLLATVAAFGFFVSPVRCNAEFGVVVHVVGTCLNFQRLTARSHHGGVQGLVDTEAWG